MEESRKKLSKIQNEKTKENREFSEKINVLTNEKMVMQKEVTGLKETLEREVSKVEKKMKKNNEMEAKKVEKLEKDLRETEARLESERRVSSQLLENKELLMVEISRKESERKTLRSYNDFLQEELSKKGMEIQTLKSYNNQAAMKIFELEEEVQQNQAQIDIIGGSQGRSWRSPVWPHLPSLRSGGSSRRFQTQPASASQPVSA